MLELESPRTHVAQRRERDHVYLLPGQWFFGKRGESVKTLLGSCVGVTLWHPVRKMGGMCHFLLPERRRGASDVLDGRYGDEAVQLLVKELCREGLKPSEFEAQLYGGADTMPDEKNLKTEVGERNVEKAWGLIDQYGFQLMAVDVGGNEPRCVAIDLLNGEVSFRRGAGASLHARSKP